MPQSLRELPSGTKRSGDWYAITSCCVNFDWLVALNRRVCQ